MLTKIFFQALKMLTIVQNFCGFFTSFQISTIHDTATRTPITYKIEEAKGSQKLSLKTWIWQTVESFIFGQQLAMNWQVLCPNLNTIFLSQFVLWFWYIQITGCPRSNLAERNGYNFTRVHFWPHVDKVKMCCRNIHFF